MELEYHDNAVIIDINESNTAPCNQELTQGTESLETLILGYVKSPRLTGNTEHIHTHEKTLISHMYIK